MKNFILSLAVVFGLLQTAHASQMSEPVSKCFTLKSISADHQIWKTNYSNFKSNYLLSEVQKFELSREYIRLAMDRLKNLQTITNIYEQNDLISETSRFLIDTSPNMHKLSHNVALNLMSSATPKFEKAIDELLESELYSNPMCEGVLNW